MLNLLGCHLNQVILEQTLQLDYYKECFQVSKQNTRFEELLCAGYLVILYIYLGYLPCYTQITLFNPTLLHLFICI